MIIVVQFKTIAVSFNMHIVFRKLYIIFPVVF